uniref:Uncharacterized protein n=1 Tax=Stomoxys calcitrans TaxID=35570 RepID=A0A1I8PE49_STOCA
MQNIKYKPIKDIEEDEDLQDLCPTHRNRAGHHPSAEVGEPFHIHWSMKLLCLAFFFTHLVYVSYESGAYRLLRANGNSTTFVKPYDNDTYSEYKESHGILQQQHLHQDITTLRNYDIETYTDDRYDTETYQDVSYEETTVEGNHQSQQINNSLTNLLTIKPPNDDHYNSSTIENILTDIISVGNSTETSTNQSTTTLSMSKMQQHPHQETTTLESFDMETYTDDHYTTESDEDVSYEETTVEGNHQSQQINNSLTNLLTIKPPHDDDHHHNSSTTANILTGIVSVGNSTETSTNLPTKTTALSKSKMSSAPTSTTFAAIIANSTTNSLNYFTQKLPQAINLTTINRDESINRHASTMNITSITKAPTSPTKARVNTSSRSGFSPNNSTSSTVMHVSTQRQHPTTPSFKKKKQGTQRKFYINTSRCHMPYVNPFTPEARKLFKPSHSTGCTKDKAIVSVRYDDLNRQYLLHIDYAVAMTLVKKATKETIVDDLRCCYRQIERAGSGGSADSKFHLLSCTNFHQDFVVPTHIKGVIVDCTSKSMKNAVIQQDAFTFIQVKGASDKNNTKGPPSNITEEKNDGRKLGILLIGIDSLSRINFRRTMPETAKYLDQKGWYELRGYNKVGDNTFPNLMPLLTGYGLNRSMHDCNPKIPGGLDKCTFIWNRLKKHGFVTAYAEDTPTISTFNYLKKGFLKQPTDHYYHPIALAIEKSMKLKKKAALNYCVGRHQSGEYVYDFGVEFAKRYQNQSNFALLWTNSFSHNAFDTAATMDNRMVAYLKELESHGILETSVVLFFSDHGRRWGSLLKLPEGFLEERLPMFFISLPKWIKHEYPALVRNLEVNQGRLITPFDIHVTLLDLARLVDHTVNTTTDNDCAQAQSILEVIPEGRTCDDACIPESWCTCIPYITQSTKSDIVKKVAHLILDEMNNYLAAKNITALCSKLSLSRISSAQLRDVDVPAHIPPNIATYKIEFSTDPKTKPLTEFSATVDYDTKLKKLIVNVEDISRQSLYEKTAQCVEDKQQKKYCICKNALKH